MNLKFNCKNKKTLLLWSALAVIFGCLTGWLGDILLPFASAILAFVFLVDNRESHIVSISVAVLTLASATGLNVAIGGFWSPIGLEIVAVAFLMSYMFDKGFSKAGSAAIITAVVALFSIISLALYAMNASGSYNFEVVKTFYLELYDGFKADFVSGMDTIISEYQSSYAQGGATISINAEEILDAFASLLVSVLILTAFLITGLAYKVFSALLLRYSAEPEKIVGWRFITPSLYAYFYIFLSFAYFIVAGESDALAITLLNLYNVFSFVYAYIGFNFAHVTLASRRGAGFAWIVMILAIVMFASMAIQLLSVLGVLFTIYYNKTHSGSVSVSKD